MKPDIGLATALRAPMQGRSKASYERMLAAAEALLVAHGSDEFTLAEVSRKGRVSIGSIYNRFESKDALLHAVQLRIMERVDAQMHARIAAARQSAASLGALVPALIEAIAETLRECADLMRPLMQRASSDPLVAATGKASYAATANAFKEALLVHAGEIAYPDRLRAVDAAFRVLYASIARYLGFGSSTTAAWEGDWTLLKEDLGYMISAFLATAPAA